MMKVIYIPSALASLDAAAESELSMTTQESDRPRVGSVSSGWSKSNATATGEVVMKALAFALVAGLAIATTGAVSAHADTFTVHGYLGTQYGGK